MWFWCLSSRKFYRIKTWILAAFLLPLEGGSGFAQGGTWPGWKPPFFCTIWSHLLGTNENFEPNNIWVPLYTIICRNTCFTINICVACMHVYYWQLVAFFFFDIVVWMNFKEARCRDHFGWPVVFSWICGPHIYIYTPTYFYIYFPSNDTTKSIWMCFNLINVSLQ